MFQLTQNEWMDLARHVAKTSMLAKIGRCEPLLTYVQFVLKEKKETTAPAAPNILGPRLTADQKRELLDAFYWAEIKHDDKYRPVLQFYKLFGWYVRLKDGYRIMKTQDARQLVLKRSKLIQNGELSLQPRETRDADRIKSRRGRKRKNNANL